MAVRHGYGKIAGTDALVFAYDTGDTRNSYRGEPTTNRFATEITDATLSSLAIDSGASSNPQLGAGGFCKVALLNGEKVVAINRGTSNGAYYENRAYWTIPLTAGNYYSWSAWVYSTVAGPRLNLEYYGGDYTWGVAHTYNVHTGTGWEKLYARANSPATSNTQTYCFIYLYTDSTVYVKDFQLENQQYPTQFVNGTRSATQGLLDLTGNSSIDLSNVSFDSNAQMTFDGTDDYVDLPSASWNILTTHTLEAVFKANGTPGSGYHVMFQKEGGYSGGAVYGLRANPGGSLLAMICYDNQAASQNWLSGGTLVNGQWYHVIATFDSSYNWKLYINGTLANSTTLTGNPYQNSSSITIGQGDGRKTYGDLPIMKIYNRALTADEVRNNYNHYKSRFNI